MRASDLRRGGGTETARPIDSGRVGRAVAQPGIDLRYWVSYGTVCTMGDDGSFDFADGQAIYTSADGCYVDVLLHPAMQHVTARYPGVQGGASGTIYTPIRPGDEVLVEIPDGDLRTPPVITRILTAEHSRLPLNPDRTPIWQNDRILVHGASVPVEIRTAGGASITVNQDGSVDVNAGAVVCTADGNVNINQGSNGVARVGDSVSLTLNPADITAIATSAVAAGLLLPGLPSAPPAPVPVTGVNVISSGSGTVVAGG